VVVRPGGVKREEIAVNMDADRASLASAERAFDSFRRFFATRDPGVLAAARDQLAQIPDRPLAAPELAQRVNSLGADLRAKFGETDDPIVLDVAIEAYEKALSITPTGSEDRPYFLSSLALGLTDRFDLSHSPTDADRATEAAEAAVWQAGIDSRWSIHLRLNLLKALIARHQAAGDDDDLEAALELETELTRESRSSAVSDPDFEQRWDEVVANPRYWLGRALVERDERLGLPGDLDAGIELLRSAAGVTPEYVADLTVSLRRRFDRTGHLDDIDEAVRATEQALEALRASDSTPVSLVAALQRNLGIARRTRYILDPDPDRLSEVVETFRAALDLIPSSDPGRFRDLSNLANSLADRHDQLGDPGDLDKAIELYETALKETPGSGEERELIALNLGAALAARYRRDHNRDELSRAIASFEHGLGVLSVNSPDRPAVLGNLGAALAEVHAAEGRSEDLRRGIAVFREAAETGLAVAPKVVVTATRRWGQWATDRGSWNEAAEAYRLGIDAMVRSVAGETARRNKETWLIGAAGMPIAAAYALVQAGAFHDAVIALERGRTVLMSQALEQPRWPLREAEPALATVAAVAGGEPLVYLAAAPHGGFALIVRPGMPVTVDHVPLVDFDKQSLDKMVMEYIAAYVSKDDDRAGWLGVLDRTGAWLWSTVIGPVCLVLGSSRAVVVPVGPLALLPVHAAWREDREAPSGRRYAIDELRLSYAPSARALRFAGRNVVRAATDSVLAIDDPQPVNAPVLRHAAREAEFALAGATRKLRLRKHRATRGAVLDALGEFAVLHFACHALADLIDPLRGGFILAGNARLSLADLQSHQLSARLAVLSACETAMTGLKLSDEVVGLPTGLLQSGVRGVVGSLWSVNDLSTLLLMGRFYELWHEEGVDPRDALRRAQLWVRDASNEEKRKHFPEFEELGPPAGISPAAREFWGHARAHAHPYHWAGFTYVGA
jgi:tetratricopeptide (TPR) repeat protein